MSQFDITYSSELMENYRQAEIMSPEKKFEALQTQSGESILFSIGTDNNLYVTEELQGHKYGWEKKDLSSALIAKDFVGKKDVTCKTFEAAQNVLDGTIGVAMVINDSLQDHLYLCLGNSNTNTDWINNPNWVSVPYDNDTHKISSLQISNVLICESVSNSQYIVVDVLRDPASAIKLISRYYIDMTKTDGYAWHPHDIDIDLESDRYMSCLGRQKGQMIDGLYTYGNVGSNTQFIYQPLYNVWSPNIPASAARLSLPSNVEPDAMATCINADFSTDLFVTSKKSLYYFESSNQRDGAVATHLLDNDMFISAKKLYAFKASGNVVVWGLNGDNDVFYTSCPVAQVSNPNSWSYPLPILTEVDMFSPYLNKANDGNTFFAVAQDKLTRMDQSPLTTTWSSQSITLPASQDAKAKKENSYTTRIQITDDQKQPISGETISISSKTRTSVHINHLYYTIDNVPIKVKTDAFGSVTIIEWVDSLQGTELIISGGQSDSIHINPMSKPINKIGKLNTPDKLKGAQITNYDGTQKPLISSNVSDSDIKKVSAGNASLLNAYNQVASPLPQTNMFFASPVKQPESYIVQASFADAIWVEAGDLFNWLKSGVEHVIHIVEDEASKQWYFVANIAGKVHKCVLDCAQKVAGAFEWLYNVIKTAVEDLIKFLKFLFEWNDITRTKDVIKNLTKLFLQHEVDQIKVVKEKLDTEIQNLVKVINGWAGITDWKGLGSAGTSGTTNSSTPTHGLGSPSTMLSYHMENNAGNIVHKSPIPVPDAQDGPISTLLQALKNEGTILDVVFDQFSELASDYSSLDLESILNKVVAIIADGVLESAQNVIDALLDILNELASEAIKILDTPIYIPVVSDILEDFGVPELSFLDLFCYVAAVPVTLGYKIAKDEAPFPDNEETNFLKSATSYQQVVDAFNGSAPLMAANNAVQSTDALVKSVGKALTMSDSTKSAVFVTGHAASGFFTLMSCFTDGFEAAEEPGTPDGFGIPSAIIGVLNASSVGITNYLVPKDPIENTVVSLVSKITTGSVILSKILFSGPAQDKFGASTGVMKNLKVGDGRATGAIVNSILIIPALACTIWHFVELAEKPAGKTRSDAIIDETSNITSYISRISYAVAVNNEDPRIKAVSISIMRGANVCTSGSQTAEAIVD